LGIKACPSFAVGVFIGFGKEYPIAHIGNLAMACILTYAVVRHRLLDVKIIFRRALAWLSLGIIGAGMYGISKFDDTANSFFIS
jgi:NhaP-type Na+/H+ and K+/H+ antiporter